VRRVRPPLRVGGYRAHFIGVLRNVAQGFETKRGRELGRQPDSSVHWSDRSDPGTSPSSVFDRAWARTGGDAAWRRYELLCIRFQENLPNP